MQRAARLLFTATEDQLAPGGAQPTQALIGHTRDMSTTGLSLIVPGVHESDSEFFGVRQPLRIVLSLPAKMIDLEVDPVRYEWLGEQLGKRSYLIGARITNISDADATQFNEYLGRLLASSE